MRRVLRMLSLLSLLFLIVQVSMVLAQAVTTTPQAPPVAQDSWRILFSILIPAISTFGGPLLTRYMGGLPDVVKYAISGIIGIISSVLGSEYTAYPMHPDAAAASGVTMSALGQKLLHMEKSESATSNPGTP